MAQCAVWDGSQRGKEMVTWTKQSKVSLGSTQILEDMDGLDLEFMDGTDFEDMSGTGIFWTKQDKTETTWS